jgi:hypothetical protein
MLSVVGEEYIAYSESVKGQYTPMVAIQRYDGTLTYREIVKEDLLRIRDDQTLPGGWIFRKSQNTASSWVKRFALLRGSFLFFFHSPQNEKPIAVVPLEDCTVVAPDMGHKTFDEMRSYKANEGFEFDIRHNARSTVRLYTLSDRESLDWIASCNARIDAAATRRNLEGGAPQITGTGNMVITSTKLSGLSLLTTATVATTSSTGMHGTSSSTGFNTHSSLPPLPSEPYPYSNTFSTTATYPYSQSAGSVTASSYSPQRGNPNVGQIPSAPVPMAPGMNTGSFYGGLPPAPGGGRPAVYAQSSQQSQQVSDALFVVFQVFASLAASGV